MFVSPFSDDEIARCTCPRTPNSITAIGKLDEFVWKIALESPGFVDVVSGRTCHAGWSWNRIGDPNNDIPEQFTKVHFSTQPVTEATGVSRG